MAIKHSISEIIKMASTASGGKDAKIQILRENNSQPLQQILKMIYDKSVVFLLPNTAPPWNKNQYEDEARNMLYRETRRLKIFIEGGGYDNLSQVKRESLFISLLEDIDNNDAELLANYMVTQKAVKGLSKAVVAEAFPGLIEE